MIDTATLNARVDLLDLIGGDTRLHKVSSSRGGEYAGPCPSCGGRDRFHVQPAVGIWFCRVCHDRWSDAIGYVMWRDGLSFPDAVRSLGGDPYKPDRGPGPRTAPPAPPPPPPPPPRWQARAERLVLRAREVLWSDEGERARRWLAGRGLSEAAVRRFCVGLIPEEYSEPPDLWGLILEPGMKLKLPRGVTLPWLVGDGVWAIKVRRPWVKPPEGQKGPPKSVAIAGFVSTIFGSHLAAGRSAVLLPEGELDTLLAWEEVGDLVDVLTLGSATRRLDSRVRLDLLPYRRVLVCRDDDKAGRQGMEAILAKAPRMRRLDLPGVHDLTDFVQQGGDLRRLVADALEAP